MLKVLFSRRLEGVADTNLYFNNKYERAWFEDDIVKQIIKDIDKSDVIGLNVISPVLGSISIERISEGAKALILMYKTDKAVNLVSCGNNCQEWIVRISNLKDVTCCYTGVDLTFNNLDISAVCLNDNSAINNDEEWVDKMIYWWDNCEEEY